MHFIKLSTSDGETRWINLEAVSRVTFGHDAPREEEFVAIIFGDGEEARLTIHGNTVENRQAITDLRMSLDELCRNC
jgi:hypothetical protein